MFHWVRYLLTIVAIGTLSGFATESPQSPLPGKPDLVDRLFIIHALGNRCVDAGERARIAEQTALVIRACRDTPAQRFRLQEIAEADPVSHDFVLMIPNTPFCLGVSGHTVSAGRTLEVQACTGSSHQRFAFDGDALLVGVQNNGVRVWRDFAIEPRDANTNEGTPLVVGNRAFSDAQYWQIIAADGSDARPTSGFVRVTNYHEFALALEQGWGTVIELAPPNDRLMLERLWIPPSDADSGTNILRAGVTLRGGRKFLYNGVEISANRSLYVAEENYALGVENQVRITGLRLRGPGERRPQEGGVHSQGILIQHNSGDAFTNVIVDHVEASHWSEVAFNVSGTRPEGGPDMLDPMLCVDRFHDKPIAKLVGNFLHHNIYSIAVGYGGYAFTGRNLFYRSRHDMTASGNAANRYIVHDSLFTSEYSDNEHMVDVHGTCSWQEHHWRGGRAGDVFDVGWNTFLNHSGRGLLVLRGTPCRSMSFYDNVTVRRESSLELWLTPEDDPVCESAPGVPFVPGAPDDVLVKANNTFRYSDPTRADNVGQLGVGDFDGDGVDDVFLGTGATWWFSSGGKAEWRFLNRMPERASELRFGDFDGDRRTDVIRVHGGVVEVSWAGGSPWHLLSRLPVRATIADIAVGQFDDDPRADLFLADGTQWRWASAGAVWDFFAFSSYRVRNLRFGDFTRDGRTDVFGIESGRWRIVRGPGEQWQDLGPARSTDMKRLVVADFDGDGIADVGRYALPASPQVPSKWLVSKSGRNTFKSLRNAPSGQALPQLPIGSFDGVAGADVLYWDSLHFRIASGGRTGALWSRQSMR